MIHCTGKWIRLNYNTNFKKIKKEEKQIDEIHTKQINNQMTKPL